MLFRLILLLTIVPFVELWLLVRLTMLWGSFSLTVLLIVGTGVVGATLARLEGLRVWRELQEKLRQGELPTDSVLDGAMVLVAAALLVTPGLITDTMGLLLLFPLSRAPIRSLLKKWLRRKMESGTGGVFFTSEYRPIRKEPPPGFPPLEDEETDEDES